MARANSAEHQQFCRYPTVIQKFQQFLTHIASGVSQQLCVPTRMIGARMESASNAPQAIVQLKQDRNKPMSIDRADGIQMRYFVAWGVMPAACRPVSTLVHTTASGEKTSKILGRRTVNLDQRRPGVPSYLRDALEGLRQS